MSNKFNEFECPRCGHCCQQQKFVELTDEEIISVVSPLAWEPTNDHLTTCYEIALNIQSKLMEKNCGRV